MNLRKEVGSVLGQLEPPEAPHPVQTLCANVVTYLIGRDGAIHEASDIAVQACEVASESADPFVEGLARMHLWGVRYVEEHFDLAEEECGRAIRAFEDADHHLNQLIATFALGRTYETDAINQQDRKGCREAREAYKKAIRTYEGGLVAAGEIANRLAYSRSEKSQERRQHCQELNRKLQSRLDEVVQQYAGCPDGNDGKVQFMQTQNVIPVVDMTGITAGNPVPMIDEIAAYALVDGDTVTIRDAKYRTRPLRVTVPGLLLDPKTHFYFIARVKGFSMNQAGIQDGDYVLLQRPLDVPLKPEHGDTVIATMCDGTDEASTIKRFEIKRFETKGPQFLLKPQSNKGAYKTIQYDARDWDKHVRVVAVAIAIFEKM